jgi:hypothetical protein
MCAERYQIDIEKTTHQAITCSLQPKLCQTLEG